jgi:tRNA threonylcarbamoyladenosine biosynthesis protein TsaB
MPLILSIDTATRSGSVALTRGENLLAERAGDDAISHSSRLLEYVGSALEEGKVKLEDVEVFAAAVGPGGFTGLRIGLATVKSFAATLKRPCIGVQTLHAVAHAAGESNKTLAMLQAGRGEVFSQLLRVGAGGEVHPLSQPSHLTPQRLLETIKAEPGLMWAGEGAHVNAEAIRSHAQREGISFEDEAGSHGPRVGGGGLWTLAARQPILAKNVSALALLRARAGDFESPESLSAIYVRASDAELNKQGQGNNGQ